MLARPGLPDFDYIKAETPDQVFQLLRDKGDKVRFYLGGTDLFIQMRDRDQGPEILLDLKGLPGFSDLNFDDQQGLWIGAAVTLNAIQQHREIRARYAALSQAAGTVGNYQLRNRATLAGNICNASPSADLAPAVLIYEGLAVLESPRGERELALDEFWLGPGKTALEANEFLKGFRFPPPPAGAEGKYLKLGRNRMGDLAIVGVAVLGYPDDKVPAGFRFRIGINSTAPVPYRVPGVEETLAGEAITDESLHKAAEGAMDISAPIEDVRATALYQKKMVRNLTFQALKEIWESLAQSDPPSDK